MGRAMTPGIDLVVVSYHSSEHLKKFVDSYEDAFGEVSSSGLTIVTVEATPEEEQLGNELAGRFLDDDARSLPVDYNVGYAKSCNWASHWGEHDTLAFFNADTELRPGVLKSCFDLLWSDDSIGVVGPRQIDLNGKLTAGGIFGTNERPKHRGWKEQDSGQYTDVKEAVTVSGSMYFIKRHVWDELSSCPLYKDVDPHSEGAMLSVFLYFEETWASYHATAHGYKVIYNGQVTGIHRWHGAIATVGEQREWFTDSQRTFRSACDHHGISHD